LSQSLQDVREVISTLLGEGVPEPGDPHGVSSD
jgi:hypothetical protein